MAYVGNEPTSNFASVTKDLFSGDGSTTAFTLSKASTTNGVAVFVENVRQEPTIAYAVSGTTLTFTAAPVSSSGNNIYVLHHNAVASTANHPAAQDLTAVKGTFTGDLIVDTSVLKVDSTNNAVGINNIIPNSFEDGAENLVVGSGSGAEGITIYSQNNNYGNIYFADGTSSSGEKARGYLVYNHSNDSLQLGTAETMRLKIDEDGNVTTPVSASMVAKKNANQDCTTEATVTAWTEYFDEGSNFNNTTGIYTCPVDGKYLLHFSTVSDTNITGSDGDGFAGNVHFSFNDGDNTVHYGYHQKSTSIRHDMFNLITIAEMSANDNIRVRATNTLVMDGVNTNLMIHLLG